jgi:hypothetical protein
LVTREGKRQPATPFHTLLPIPFFFHPLYIYSMKSVRKIRKVIALCQTSLYEKGLHYSWNYTFCCCQTTTIYFAIWLNLITDDAKEIGSVFCCERYEAEWTHSRMIAWREVEFPIPSGSIQMENQWGIELWALRLIPIIWYDLSRRTRSAFYGRLIQFVCRSSWIRLSLINACNKYRKLGSSRNGRLLVERLSTANKTTERDFWI